MEWMQTSADMKEREDFKRMHELLGIEAAAPAESITDAGVFRLAPPRTPQQEDGEIVDPELQKLNEGLQAITEDFWKRNLKTSYNTQFTGPTNNQDQDAGKVGEVVWQVLGSILNDGAM